MRCVLVLSAVLLLGGVTHAETRVVHPDGSGEWPTIQAAVAASEDGDTVELTDGTFTGAGNRDIDFLGKSITIRSQGADPLHCIIDCEGTEADPHRGFLFCSGEGIGSILEGLTIANGMARQEINGHEGGAVYCGAGASPVVVNCRFVGNAASGPPGGGAGGAVACLDNSAPVFVSCAFVGNSAYFGGAMDCGMGSAVSLTNCMFHDNLAYMGGGINCGGSMMIAEQCTFSGSYGFALACWHGSLVLMGCTLYGNSDGALFSAYEAAPSLENTLIAFNSGSIWCEDVVPALSCCDIYGNGGGDWVVPFEDQLGMNGNVSEDPLFCSVSPEDDLNWSIHSDSPCAPESSGCGLIGAWGVDCGDSSARPCTWGGLKAIYLIRRSAPN
ncbi:MAG: hypothetical protein IMY86_07455 [Chloroflexi bacterium]|nr:hypothetical protein [Chloroflexota bacterium]